MARGAEARLGWAALSHSNMQPEAGAELERPVVSAGGLAASSPELVAEVGADGDIEVRGALAAPSSRKRAA